jgi:NADH-quinone oxidoreductase subunit M
MVLAAMYLLIMVGKIVFGSLKEPDQHEEHAVLPADLSPREVGILIPLAALCLWMGVQPTLFTNAMRGSVEEVLSPYPGIVQPEQPVVTELVELKEEDHG